MATAKEIEADGQDLLHRVFTQAQKDGEQITLLLISGMMDANEFILANEELAKQVLNDVVIMGGVQVEDGKTPVKEDGFYIPDNAYNNCVDLAPHDIEQKREIGPAAQSLYRKLQELEIPTTVLTRHAAYAAYVTPDYYKDLAATDHPVAVRLYEDQKAATDNLWGNVKAGQTQRRLSKDWFLASYAVDHDTTKKHIDETGSPWPHVKSHPYDALAALAAVVPADQRLFSPGYYLGPNDPYLTVIGMDKDNHGIYNMERVHDLLRQLPVVGFDQLIPPLQYPPSLNRLEDDLAKAPDTDITELANRLINGAIRFDLDKTKTLGLNFRYKGKERNIAFPEGFTTEEVGKASYADPLTFPLNEGEEWNKGRRQTACGVVYEVTYDGRKDGLSQDEYEALPDHKKTATAHNPYMNTGINGRGCLGQNGPNHAVDNGMIVIKDDENGTPAIYALGILRKYDGNAPAFSGGFAKFRVDENGEQVFDKEAVIDTQLEELFEEMISGSVELLPEYQAQLPLKLALETQNRAMSVQNPRLPHKLLSEDEIKHLETEIITGLKLQQVKDKDPAFIQRLRDVVANGQECFAGPVLNDNRNTNNAWIETRLSWFMMDDDIWEQVKGDNPVFDYAFSAGDDASGVVYHKLDANLLEAASASHGPMFAFMAASFILDAQDKGIKLDPSIIAQINTMADFLEQRECDTPQIQTKIKARP